MTTIDPDAYLVDGTGQIIRPGDPVSIQSYDFNQGQVVSIERDFHRALVDVGAPDPVYFPFHLLARADEPAVWVMGSL